MTARELLEREEGSATLPKPLAARLQPLAQAGEAAVPLDLRGGDAEALDPRGRPGGTPRAPDFQLPPAATKARSLELSKTSSAGSPLLEGGADRSGRRLA